MQVAVIGSGPSGIACAKALIRRGLVPTVIDVGETLPASRRAVLDRMVKLSPSEWDEQDLGIITANPTMTSGDVPKKLVFGSDFYFARDRSFNPSITEAGLPDTTFALGGYSVAWGAAVLPTHDDDLGEWPIGSRDLGPSYRRVLSDLPLSAAHDNLEIAFPLFKDSVSPLPIPEDARALLADLASIVCADNKAPFLCGQARLTVDASACRRCGLCLSGCMYGAIHWFGPEIEALSKKGALHYRAGYFVERLHEDDTGVCAIARDTATGEVHEERFEYVFLAAGAIQSTRVVLASRGLFNRRLEMKDSQKFIVPLVRARRFPLAWPNSVTLSSIFVDFKVPQISQRWIHAQVSSVNDYVLQRLGISPRSSSLRRRILAPLYERLLVAYCGLHSDHSSGMTLTLASNSNGDPPVLQVRRNINPQSEPTVRRIAKHFARRLWRSGTWVATPALVVGRPGGGNHFGGTLPMRASPKGELETDTLGRLSGWRRIHVVDGAVLPSIPATTLALLQMANADRITTAVEFQ